MFIHPQHPNTCSVKYLVVSAVRERKELSSLGESELYYESHAMAVVLWQGRAAWSRPGRGFGGQSWRQEAQQTVVLRHIWRSEGSAR